MEERPSRPRSQNKKIANYEWRVLSTGLCDTSLRAKNGGQTGMISVEDCVNQARYH